MSGLAFVRKPGPRLADGIVTHQDPVPVDMTVAAMQWRAYVDVLADGGWEIVEVAPADDCPDAVFIEDALVVFDDLAVITRPGAEARRGEIEGAESAARTAGLDIVRIEPPATFDGGDVLKVGRDVYVGLTGRTNQAAIDQLTAILEPRGWRVIPVPVTRVLHLKSAITALPDGTVIGYPAFVDDPTWFERWMAVPEPAGAHVVLLGADQLLMSADAPRTAELFEQLGYRPVLVEIGEFEKLEGCVTCLSVRVRR